MTRSLVCGVDGTPASRQAAAFASRLARDLGSRAVLSHVVAGGAFLPRVPPVSGRRARRVLKSTVAEHRFPPGTQLRVDYGDPAPVLKDIAEREDAELLVVGGSARSTVEAVLLGSVSETLMRDAPCPVVVVPADTVAPIDATGVLSVVCGVPDDDEAPAVLRLASDLAARLGAQLHAVHAYDAAATQLAMPVAVTPPLDDELRDAAWERLTRALDGARVDAQPHVTSQGAVDGLCHVAEQEGAGLIVVGRGRRGRLTSMVLGAVPLSMARKGRAALVVLQKDTEIDLGSGHYELMPTPERERQPHVSDT